ncbi:GDSL-type esterase/lipase family protein [Cryptosporangium sp. NPDC048952]|uniref:GDSL-type esterase/lipase family protein n=1 Tax=Cryptosporangium sp. NPDC048952 TaxID=3363961 RepID=UPI003723ABCD
MTTNDGWVRTWAASPQAPTAGLGSLDDVPPFADVTLRQAVRITGGGHRIRVRFTNEYGTTPLVIGAARVNDRTLTFNGNPTAVVPAGAPILTDPLDLSVPALATLAISLYLPERVETCTCHDPALDDGWVIPGNADTLPADAEPLPVRALLSAVEVLPDTPATTVVVLGDSRVDGIGSTPGANRSWPELLAERSGRYVSNQGISGNRLLNDGLGDSGLRRFDRDVLATPGLSHVVVALGANDIAISFAPQDGPSDFLKMFPGDPVTPDDVIAGYRQLIARAHGRGVKIYAATTAPYEGDDIFTPEGDAARRLVNDWIRTSGAFDAVLDFDEVWRDPEHPSRIREEFHMGDHLHGSDAGYQAIADSIDLALFR